VGRYQLRLVTIELHKSAIDTVDAGA